MNADDDQLQLGDQSLPPGAGGGGDFDPTDQPLVNGVRMIGGYDRGSPDLSQPASTAAPTTRSTSRLVQQDSAASQAAPFTAQELKGLTALGQGAAIKPTTQPAAPPAIPPTPPSSPPASGPMPFDPYDPRNKDDSPPPVPGKVDVDVAEKLAEMQAQITAMNAELSKLRKQPIPSGTGHLDSPTPRFPIFPVRLDTPTHFVEEVVVSNALVDSPALQARTGDLVTPVSNLGFVAEVDDGTTKRFVQVAGSGGLRWVILKNGTGLPGDSTTAANWVYDVYEVDGTTLILAAVSPQQARSIGITNKAPDGSYGFGSEISMTFTLAIALGEYRGKATSDCSP